MKFSQALFATAIALLITAAPAAAVSQSQLAGYRGVRFGESQTSAQAKLRTLFGTLRYASGDPYYKGTIVGYRETTVFPFFLNNKFTGVMFGFSSQQGSSSIDVYYDLRKKIVAAYGEHTWTGFFWYPDSKPDNDLSDSAEEEVSEEKANATTLEGHTYLSTRWEFNDGNRILLETEKGSAGMWVSLTYRSPELIKREDNRRTQTEL